MEPKQIKQKLIHIAHEIFKGHNILFAYLYGSVALEHSHRFSDIDIGVYIRDMPLEECRKLEMDIALLIDDKIQNALESDVRIMNHLPLALTGIIVTDGILIYCEDDKMRTEYEAGLRMAYFDFYPSIKTYQKTYLEQTKVAEKIKEFPA